jgi:ribonuclease P protein component
MAIASKFRIAGQKRIEEVKDKGTILQSSNFGVVYLKNEGLDYSRFAFVISSKISKLAVHRNRVERSIQEAIRRQMTNIPTGYDIVFLVKKSIANKTTEEIMREVEKFVSAFKPK